MSVDPRHSGSPEDLRELARRIRAAADGELEHVAGGPPSDERGREAVRFERELREAVRRVMGSERAPSGLRERVEAAMAEQNSTDTRDEPVRSLPFPSWARRGGFWLAAAAAVAIGSSAIFMRGGPAGSGASSTLTAQRATILVNFATGEHERCASFSDHFDGKMRVRTLAEAQTAAVELLQRVPDVLELGSKALAEAGYKFEGMGQCHVPGPGRSAHLLYRPDPTIAPGAPAVSLFVQEDTGDLTLAPACSYKRHCPKEKTGLTIWKKDGLIFYLVEPAGMSEAVRSAFAVPRGNEVSF